MFCAQADRRPRPILLGSRRGSVADLTDGWHGRLPQGLPQAHMRVLAGLCGAQRRPTPTLPFRPGGAVRWLHHGSVLKTSVHPEMRVAGHRLPRSHAEAADQPGQIGPLKAEGPGARSGSRRSRRWRADQTALERRDRLAPGERRRRPRQSGPSGSWLALREESVEEVHQACAPGSPVRGSRPKGPARAGSRR